MNCLVNVDVDELSRAIRFYEAAFDLKPGRRFGSTGIEMLGGSAPIYLLEKAAGTRAHPGADLQARDYTRHWTPVHLDFFVDDLDAAVTKACAAGAALEHPVGTQAWGRLAQMSDPFGHGFCFVQFLGRGYDEIAR